MSRTLPTKTAAEHWVSLQRVALSRDEWISPKKGTVTFNEVADVWLARRDIRESTRDEEMMFLTAEQTHAVSDSLGDFRGMGLLVGFGGLRLGEVLGLRVDDVGADAVSVKRTVSELASGVSVGAPKTRKAVRTVALPRCVVESLPTGSGYLFSDTLGGPFTPEELAGSSVAARGAGGRLPVAEVPRPETFTRGVADFDGHRPENNRRTARPQVGADGPRRVRPPVRIGRPGRRRKLEGFSARN